MTTDLDHLKSISAELHAWRVRFNAGQRMKTGDLDAIIQGIDRLITGPGEAENQVAAAKNDLNNATSDVDRTAARARLRAAEEHLQQVQDVNAKIVARELTGQRTPSQRSDAEKAVAAAETKLRFATEDERAAAQVELSTAKIELAKHPEPGMTRQPFDERGVPGGTHTGDFSGRGIAPGTGDTHSNSTTIENIPSTDGLHFGQTISGRGIAPGTRIDSVMANSITMTNPATETVTGTSFTVDNG